MLTLVMLHAQTY